MKRLCRRTHYVRLKGCRDTAQNDGMILNFALNYGGRTEIVTLCKALAEKVKEGSLDIEDIDESLFLII